MLGVREGARLRALLGPGPPTLYVCCALGTRAGAACVFNFTSLHHPSLQLIYASSQGEASFVPDRIAHRMRVAVGSRHLAVARRRPERRRTRRSRVPHRLLDP